MFFYVSSFSALVHVLYLSLSLVSGSLALCLAFSLSELNKVLIIEYIYFSLINSIIFIMSGDSDIEILEVIFRIFYVLELRFFTTYEIIPSFESTSRNLISVISNILYNLLHIRTKLIFYWVYDVCVL